MDVQNNFPFEIKDVEPQLNVELLKYYTGEHTGFVRVGPKRYFLPQKYREEAFSIYNMKIRSDDIFISSYPRSGTTWFQEIVWMLANDLDYTKSATKTLPERSIFLERSLFTHSKTMEKLLQENSSSEPIQQILVAALGVPGSVALAQAPSPRFINTHLPLSLLPPSLLDTAKMVYVARDPRDVAISWYHFNRLLKSFGYIGDFKTFWNFFIRDLSYWAPYFEQVKEAWQKRDHSHMLFLFYEDLFKDLPAVIRRVSAFLNKQYTDEQIADLCDHLNFNNFKSNESVNYDASNKLGVQVPGEQFLFRIGKVGSWCDYFDDEMTQQAERWIAVNQLDTDLRFPHVQN